ncbi:MAG: YajQ family cyclic di-GMP-binding protein [Candidatus Lambdaproteobacteria bacterium]|nr:YajQ family cyclic di-GMP-binding protein [Candidatus Lambdaproteobacteria bacterium]
MPTFDVISEVNQQEVTNAVDQANREVGTRFDFKEAGARYELDKGVVTMRAAGEFHLKAMLDVLQSKLVKRGVDLKCLSIAAPAVTGKEARQAITLRQGIDAPLARQLVKMVKDSKLKVQASIQENKLRISGKKRDDLQAVIALLREAKVDMPLQFDNMRD